MDEYTLLSPIIEFTILLGVSFAILIFHELNLYIKKGKLFEVLQLIGGFMIAGGMIVLRATRVIFSSPSTALFIILLPFTGSLLILLPFFAIRHFEIDKEFKAQLSVLLLSLLIYYFLPLPALGKIVGALASFILISLVFLMKLISSLPTCTRFNKNLTRVASWLLILHAWLRYYSFKNPQTCIHYGVLLIYFTSLLMWVYSTLRTYETLRRWI
ncbi:hypothetical protein [Thermococcus alcaliphilus]|uniref:hypothetical protein n=1 Tax=Thermococcus alcaliphilus TaxID=139207 RepID=UPI00209003D5|nr:hypothetical protein [Thermococcus alcaliphilus]MCO6042115.1 hypothetical protein [Thermococcus alcaliphilus]